MWIGTVITIMAIAVVMRCTAHVKKRVHFTNRFNHVSHNPHFGVLRMGNKSPVLQALARCLDTVYGSLEAQGAAISLSPRPRVDPLPQRQFRNLSPFFTRLQFAVRK